MTLFAKGEVIKSYPIALGGNPVGPKEKEGDNKTPEGYYFIDSRNGNSGFHLSLHISYPNAQDKMRARELGVCPGGRYHDSWPEKRVLSGRCFTCSK